LSPRHPSKKPKSILVVDDEPGIVDVLIAVLSDAGYRASGAAHGQEALSKLQLSVPDLMLLDLEMPVLDGGDTLRALRTDARLASVGVVMMSGIPESMVRRRCRGFEAFLRKPFSLDELLETLSALADGRAAANGGGVANGRAVASGGAVANGRAVANGGAVANGRMPKRRGAVPRAGNEGAARRPREKSPALKTSRTKR